MEGWKCFNSLTGAADLDVLIDFGISYLVLDAIYWYTRVINAVPSDATVLSNRSMCWARLNEGNIALSDAQASTSGPNVAGVGHWVAVKAVAKVTASAGEGLRVAVASIGEGILCKSHSSSE
ncbi:hypothetical protein U1Q18_025593 [Sarracenia purpurea var. burkii]